jgi:hypothetical protein
VGYRIRLISTTIRKTLPHGGVFLFIDKSLGKSSIKKNFSTMKNITNIRKRLLKIEEAAKYLHEKVFEAFKEVADKKGIEYMVIFKNNFFYSIECGTSNPHYPYGIFYNDGQIELWKMKSGKLDQKIEEWKTVESFKQNFSSHIKS